MNGNPENDGTALYVGVLDIRDRTQIDMQNLKVLPFFGDAVLFYDTTLPENEYLLGKTYTFATGGGMLSARVPEPATIWLAAAMLLLVCHKISHKIPMNHGGSAMRFRNSSTRPGTTSSMAMQEKAVWRSIRNDIHAHCEGEFEN